MLSGSAAVCVWKGAAKIWSSSRLSDSAILEDRHSHTCVHPCCIVKHFTWPHTAAGPLAQLQITKHSHSSLTPHSSTSLAHQLQFAHFQTGVSRQLAKPPTCAAGGTDS